MKIEAVSIRNYRVFQDAQAKDLPGLMVILGKNGSGKTTFFDVFGFLHDCLLDNVSRALAKRGGYQEVVSREHCGEDISIEIKFLALFVIIMKYIFVFLLIYHNYN